MSFDQVNFLENSTKIPINEIQRILKANSYKNMGNNRANTFNMNSNCSVYALQEEKINNLKGGKVTVNRVFIKGDILEYEKTGWLMYNDVEFCMMCCEAFNLYRGSIKLHCYACGNIFCSSCIQEKATIIEIDDIGPQNCCTLCYWGQECVLAVNNFIIDTVAESIIEQPSSQIEEEETVIIRERDSMEAFQAEVIQRLDQQGILTSTSDNRNHVLSSKDSIMTLINNKGNTFINAGNSYLSCV